MTPINLRPHEARALAEHLAAMDPGQRGAAMDQVKHAIGDWG